MRLVQECLILFLILAYIKLLAGDVAGQNKWLFVIDHSNISGFVIRLNLMTEAPNLNLCLIWRKLVKGN